MKRQSPKQDLKSYKNKHRGERCFILACGPSLLEVEPLKLAKEFKISVNHAIYRFPESQYSVIGDLKNGLEINTGDSVLFSSSEPQHIPGSIYMKDLGHLPGWSWDLEKGAYFGHTTSYLALQIASYLGFNPIYLVGLDLKDHKELTHFYGNREWQAKHARRVLFDAMANSFEWAYENELKGRKQIFNCSKESRLTCFPYIDLEKVIV